MIALRSTLLYVSLFALLTLAATGRSSAADAQAETLKVVTDSTQTLADRDGALRQLAQTLAGANAILALADKGELDDELRGSAAYALALSPDEAIRKLGAAKLPLPATKEGKALPGVTEFLALKGDVKRGEAVFNDAKGANCASCHVVGDKGRDFGPPLSTIGEKGKDILLESVLLPSVAIQHGFHGYSVKLKNGTVKTGILIDDTDEKVTLKDLNGEFIDIPAAEISKKSEMKQSLMPEGLAATMTQQEFADLLEYLASLKVQ